MTVCTTSSDCRSIFNYYSFLYVTRRKYDCLYLYVVISLCIIRFCIQLNKIYTVLILKFKRKVEVWSSKILRIEQSCNTGGNANVHVNAYKTFFFVKRRSIDLKYRKLNKIFEYDISKEGLLSISF